MNRPIPGQGRVSILNYCIWFGQQDDEAARQPTDAPRKPRLTSGGRLQAP